MIFGWLNKLLGLRPPEGQWVLIAEQAAQALAAYREGRWGSVNDWCPRCAEVANLGNAVYLGRNHPKGDARVRWRANEAETRFMIAALGPCLCGQAVLELESVQQAETAMRPYLGRMAMGG